MSDSQRLLTFDANVLVGVAKRDEPFHKKCVELLSKVPDSFFLCEPSIIYQEVCGTISRRVGSVEAREFGEQLDKLIPSEFLIDCDRSFCLTSYELCSQYGIYAIDALYFSTSIKAGSILVSLDKEDFVDKLKSNHQGVETYHVSDFPY